MKITNNPLLIISAVKSAIQNGIDTVKYDRKGESILKWSLASAEDGLEAALDRFEVEERLCDIEDYAEAIDKICDVIKISLPEEFNNQETAALKGMRKGYKLLTKSTFEEFKNDWGKRLCDEGFVKFEKTPNNNYRISLTLKGFRFIGA